MDYSKVNENLKSFRENVARLNKTQFAKRIGSSRQSYTKLEDGKTSMYNKAIVKISEEFGVDAQALLFDYDRQQEITVLKEKHREEIENLTAKYEKELADKRAEIERMTKLLDSLTQSNKTLELSLQRFLKED